MIIRHVEKSDLDEVFKMGERFYAASPLLSSIGLKKPDVKKVIDLATDSDVCLFLVAEDNDRLVGMIVIFIVPHILNSEVLVSDEIAWWLDKEYRGAGNSHKLIDAAEKILVERGVKISSMKFLQDERFNPDMVQKLYESKGYKVIETSVAKRL